MIFGVYLFNKGVKKERLLNKEFREKEKQEIIENELQELTFFAKYIIILIEGVIENSLKQKAIKCYSMKKLIEKNEN